MVYNIRCSIRNLMYTKNITPRGLSSAQYFPTMGCPAVCPDSFSLRIAPNFKIKSDYFLKMSVQYCRFSLADF